MSYKRLGDYIREVNNRNVSLISEDLRGLSMSKEFRKSTSNIVGTDLSRYKLVYKNQFACDFMSIIRVHKLPVVIHFEENPVIVSPAYTVFEIIDENKLNPEYLMMWFRRPEFDRYADFKCDSAIRGGFKWEELCEVELPIPSIEKQRAIVKEYNTVVERIQLNEKLNEKLEATAQALYKQWFVDFEFPNQEGKPYKSFGGKMIYNEELDKEIPEGWEVTNLDELLEVKYGKDYKHLELGNIPLYGSGGIMKFVSAFLYDKPSVLIPRKGTLSNILYVDEPFWSVDTMFYTKLKNKNLGLYSYYYLKTLDFNALNVGSAVPSMTTKLLNSMRVIMPAEQVLKFFNAMSYKLHQIIKFQTKENKILDKISSVLLSRMSK